MKTVIVQGLVVEYKGLYWGVIYSGGGHGEGEACGWGPIERAKITDPRYVKLTTDMTYEGSSDAFELRKGRFVSVIKTITFEVSP